MVKKSQIFCYHRVEYIKFDTCDKLHDHRSNNNKVMMGAFMPPPPITDGSNKHVHMSNRVNDSLINDLAYTLKITH